MIFDSLFNTRPSQFVFICLELWDMLWLTTLPLYVNHRYCGHVLSIMKENVFICLELWDMLWLTTLTLKYIGLLFSQTYYPLANEVAKGYSNATVRPSILP